MSLLQYCGGINSETTHVVNNSIPFVETDGDYMAGQTPIKNKTNLEVMGLAVFKEDKLIGELTRSRNNLSLNMQ